MTAKGDLSGAAALIAAPHIIWSPQQNVSLNSGRRPKLLADFFGDLAQIFILLLIFQSIAVKFCNRALFRHAVQNLLVDDSVTTHESAARPSKAK